MLFVKADFQARSPRKRGISALAHAFASGVLASSPMRIAYIAPYQGPALVKTRSIIRNLSLGSNTKIELIAGLLQKHSHNVEILSQGEVVVRQFKSYPGFQEPDAFDPNIPVHYGLAFPVRFLNGWSSSMSLLRIFKARHRVKPFDAVAIYNLKPPQVTCANYAIRRMGLPVILEYEDDLFIKTAQNNGNRFTSGFYLGAARRLLGSVSGCLAGSPYLLSQVKRNVPKLLLPGIVSDAIPKAAQQAGNDRKNWVVFSGTHSKAQGLEQLVEAWKIGKLPDWELHIAGHGSLTATLHKSAEKTPTIVFHGVINGQQNARLLAAGKIAVVPYDVSQSNGFSFKTIESLAASLHVIT